MRWVFRVMKVVSVVGVLAAGCAGGDGGGDRTANPKPVLMPTGDNSSGAGAPTATAAGSGATGTMEAAISDGAAGTGAMLPGDTTSDMQALVERVFDPGTDPVRNNVQAGQVCARLAQIQCAGEAYCCDNPGRDRATCETVMADGCVNELFLDSVTASPVTGFDAGAASVAFTELERMASECDPGIAAFGGSASGLMGMFTGTIEAGGNCEPDGGPLGLPSEPAAAAALASCTDIQSQACLPRLTSWSCEPRGQAGTKCFSDLNCVDGLYCPNPTFAVTTNATCTPRRPVGQACSTPNECESLFCKGGACVAADAQAAYCLAN
ncbi:MAG: hypothetical protein OEZ06_07645 [Myxococcales bacterium]|nr:hypothetical protein [Myxococcales bacterium]